MGSERSQKQKDKVLLFFFWEVDESGQKLINLVAINHEQGALTLKLGLR